MRYFYLRGLKCLSFQGPVSLSPETYTYISLKTHLLDFPLSSSPLGIRNTWQSDRSSSRFTHRASCQGPQSGRVSRDTSLCSGQNQPPQPVQQRGRAEPSDVRGGEGEMTCPNHSAGAGIPGRMDRPLAVEQATDSVTYYLYDLEQIT